VPQGPAVDLYTRECVICLDRPRHVRFQCGHSTLCQVCARLVRCARNCSRIMGLASTHAA